MSERPEPFSPIDQDSPYTQCAEMFGAPELQILSTKIPLMPGQMPTLAMLDINQTPSEQEIRAIALLDSTIHKCAALRMASGHPTSASEDILESRVGKLRHALSNGTIPYAVYNYGLAKILKRHAAFLTQGE